MRESLLLLWYRGAYITGASQRRPASSSASHRTLSQGVLLKYSPREIDFKSWYRARVYLPVASCIQGDTNCCLKLQHGHKCLKFWAVEEGGKSWVICTKPHISFIEYIFHIFSWNNLNLCKQSECSLSIIWGLSRNALGISLIFTEKRIVFSNMKSLLHECVDWKQK